MSLFTTKYPNNIRTVSGLNVAVYNDDVVLNCNTSGGACSINLNEIPAGFWNTMYKVYVFDDSNNANTNNITVNAPAGQFINGQSSIVINTNGGGVIIRIGNNTNYLASYTSNVATATDTGWLDLNGFAWVSASLRPQYRVIDKHIIFRRSLIIPIPKAGVPLPYTGSPAYEGETTVTPATAGAGSVVLDAAGVVTFNEGNPALQSPSHYPDEAYTSGWVIGSQRRNAQLPVGSAYLALYTTVFLIQITTGGVLRLLTLNNIEEGTASQQIGQSNLRYLVGKSIAGQRILDYRDITDTAPNAATMVGRSNTGTPNDPLNIGLNSQTANHLITHDPANQSDVGGYVIPLMGFDAWK